MLICSLLFVSCLNNKEQEYTISHAQRDKIIHELIELTSLQRDQDLRNGAVDGSGLYYQGMEAYQVLLELCSEEELKEIHIQLSGSHKYIPFSERFEQRYFPIEWEEPISTND